MSTTGNIPYSADKMQMLEDMQGMIERIGHKVKSEMRDLEQSCELGSGQIVLLTLLWRSGETKASDIAARLGITSGGLTSMSDKLVGMKLIRRERSEEDRRVVLLSITDKGKVTLHQIRNARFQRLLELIGRLGEDDLQKVKQAFELLESVLPDIHKP